MGIEELHCLFFCSDIIEDIEFLKKSITEEEFELVKKEIFKLLENTKI
ncbi:MAG: hypothetical protein ACRCZG_00035 [Culicoidibacterales bacterium]